MEIRQFSSCSPRFSKVRRAGLGWKACGRQGRRHSGFSVWKAAEGVGAREWRNLVRVEGGALQGKPLPLGWPEDDRGGGATPCKVQPVLSNWRDAWPSLVPNGQELWKVESTTVRKLDREGLEQAGLTLRVLEGRTAGNCRTEQTAPREDSAIAEKLTGCRAKTDSASPTPWLLGVQQYGAAVAARAQDPCISIRRQQAGSKRQGPRGEGGRKAGGTGWPDSA